LPADFDNIKENETRHAMIVLVEDDEITRELVEVALRQEGHEVASFGDGEAAVAFLEEGRTRPDLLVTDIQLPDDFDGWAVARAFQEEHPRLPVIYITASTMPPDPVNNSIYIRKPVKSDLLLKAVAALG
jgi:CheY-like chemotaxis protein